MDLSDMEKQAIHEIIKQARKAKGMTQQDLADAGGLSLRTIQRIEKGEHDISGYSLKQISTVLEIPLEKLIMTNVEQVKIETTSNSAIKALYLSSLFFVINPLFGIIIPTILYFNKTNKDHLYKKHFRFILYYMIISMILTFGTLIIIMARIIMHVPSFTSFMGGEMIVVLGVYYSGTTILMLYRFFTLSPSGE